MWLRQRVLYPVVSASCGTLATFSPQIKRCPYFNSHQSPPGYSDSSFGGKKHVTAPKRAFKAKLFFKCHIFFKYFNVPFVRYDTL